MLNPSVVVSFTTNVTDFTPQLCYCYVEQEYPDPYLKLLKDFESHILGHIGHSFGLGLKWL